MNKQVNKYRLQSKTASHKNALIRNLVMELVRAEKIKTTPAKARIVKSQFDKLVTLAKKENGLKNIDQFFASNEKAVTKFNKLVSERLQDRNSGYTRVIKTLPRKGDNAQQVYIMLVNLEGKAKKSEMEKLLDKQKKEKDEKSIGGRIKKSVAKATSTAKAK